ncbi:hypothetical protein CR983_01810 [Candidatus Saccharibacteria bacterium]|nr:MAG: hypothetical protein CR983_01810 [Candidatus Saccharibacteria bacterium]
MDTLHHRGFTLIEALIVVVVISIIALITSVTYIGLSRDAENDARVVEAEKIAAMLDKYKIIYKDYPGFAAGTNECIGTNFPEGRCGHYLSASPSESYPETNNTLTSKLKLVGDVPDQHLPANSYVGPYAKAWGDSNGFTLYTYFEGESAADCPSATPIVDWNDPDSTTLRCSQSYTYVNSGGH